MTEATAPERALAEIVRCLEERAQRFALVGGLAVSARGEVRFTRDIDIAVLAVDDAQAERLAYDLCRQGYQPVASVEHEQTGRLSTVRLLSPFGIKVDLLFAICGIEAEIVARATAIELPGVGTIPVARAEELLAMKVLSMSETRLQDRIDAGRLLRIAEVDLDAVSANLALITERGYHGDEDLAAKLSGVA